MSLRDIIKFALIPFLAVYLSASLGYIIIISTTAAKGSLLNAFSPVVLFTEIVNGNSTIIYTIGAGTMLYIYLKRFFRREDPEEENE